MQDLEISVIVPMQASEVEAGRKFTAAIAEFCVVAWNYADQIERLMLGDDPETGKELAELVAGLKSDAALAESAKRALAPLLKRAYISDPDGRKERLQ